MESQRNSDSTSRPGDLPTPEWLALLGDRYAVQEQWSSTAASWVYRGTDRLSGRSVAIKLLKDAVASARNGFIAEALLLSELAHPGIVRYVAHGEL
jgi:serine/threonine protein kinase